jgi:hypothetical protein
MTVKLLSAMYTITAAPYNQANVQVAQSSGSSGSGNGSGATSAAAPQRRQRQRLKLDLPRDFSAVVILSSFVWQYAP